MTNNPIIILSGPTASGKSDLALNIAGQINAVIINCDSKQLYKEIPIITAQPTEEEKQIVPHDLYGVISVTENCSVGRWLDMAKESIDQVHKDGKIPLLVGGTGMYIKSLIHGVSQVPDIKESIRRKTRDLLQEIGPSNLHSKLMDLDPDMAKQLEKNDGQRIARAYEVIKQTGKSLLWWQNQKTTSIYKSEQYLHFFLNPKREKVYENCNKRFVKMIDNGLIEEMEALNKMQLSEELPSMKAHGVPEMLAYLNGTMSLEEAIDQAQKNTRRYIKRQFTWFRGQMPEAVILVGNNMEDEMLTKIQYLSI